MQWLWVKNPSSILSADTVTSTRSLKDLECGAYKILKGLLKKGLITPEQIIDASRE